MGLGPQTGERERGSALHTLVMGSGVLVVHKASLCLDQLGRVTKLLGGFDGRIS